MYLISCPFFLGPRCKYHPPIVCVSLICVTFSVCMIYNCSWLLMFTIVTIFGDCFIIQWYFGLVQTIERTIQNVQKKQALTYEEMEAEREEVS